ncbi:hypothetical protein [Streptomyces sp. NPDC046862]|uniref:hypothetical protein n=1 Tax=Streptomyces sp. NPDC046862 TaxID=3154603 RepID=UPI003452AA4A
MAVRRNVADAMATDFLSGTEAPLLRLSLARRMDECAVLTGRDGEPAGLVGPTGAWPAVVVPDDLAVEALLTDAPVLRALLDGVPAVVVTRGGRPVGVIAAGTVTELLAAELAATGPGNVLGLEVTPPGVPEAPDPSAPLRLRCGVSVCRATNSFPRWPPDTDVECSAGGHLFVPFWAE